jgi:hypothetical protein
MSGAARRLALCAIVSAATWALVPAGHAAPGDITGWNGVNPFQCELQQAAFEATGPAPDTDPYCVDFDKTHQNVTELGVVQFLSLEPARVAAAGPKCFYFQSDHWRGSIVQDDGSTKTYEWDGHYFFDKAKGDGGAWVTNFNVNGRTGDPSQIPGMPQEFAQHMGPGTGGVIIHNDIPADPDCAARADADPQLIYSSYAPPPTSGGGTGGCPSAPGGIGTDHVGPVALRDTERTVRQRMGPPYSVVRGFLRYCVRGGGRLMAGELEDRSGDLGEDPDARIVLVATTSRTLATKGVAAGDRASELRRSFPRARKKLTVDGTTVRVLRRGTGLIAGVRRGRVSWIGAYDRGALRTTRGLRAVLSRMR